MSDKNWSHFRKHMPYGCEYNPESKTLQFFNRDYSYVSANGSVWRTTDEQFVGEDGKTRTKHFYGDGTKPLQSAKDLEAYQEALSEFKEWTEVGNTQGYATRSAEYYLEKSKTYAIGL